MAVPLTAVFRIYLEAIDHPLPRYCAHALAGTRPSPAELARRATTADVTTELV